MEPYKIVMLALFAAGVVAMIVMKIFNMGSRRRGVVKCISSALFVAMAAINFVSSVYELRSVALLGILFAAAGDVFLVFTFRRSEYHRTCNGKCQRDERIGKERKIIPD